MRFLKLFRAFKPRKTKQRDSRGRIHTIVGSFLSLASKQMERVLLKTVELSSRVTKKVESFWSNLNLFSTVAHVVVESIIPCNMAKRALNMFFNILRTM